jgi:signal peptidase I
VIDTETEASTDHQAVGVLVRAGRAAVIATLAMAALLLLAVLVPRLFGWETLIVRTNSMAGSYPAGDLVAARPVDRGSVAVGDVILVEQGEGVPVLHRIIEARDEGELRVVRTKGDANATPDPNEYILPDEVLVARYGVPYLGYLAVTVTSRLGWLLFVVLPASVLAAKTLLGIWSVSEPEPAAEPAVVPACA